MLRYVLSTTLDMNRIGDTAKMEAFQLSKLSKFLDTKKKSGDFSNQIALA